MYERLTEGLTRTRRACCRKAPAHHREELESGHLRHVEIGNDDVRHHPPELQKSVETMLRSANVVPLVSQEPSQNLANSGLVINDKDMWSADVRHVYDPGGVLVWQVSRACAKVNTPWQRNTLGPRQIRWWR